MESTVSQLDSAIAIALREMTDARERAEAAAERYNDLVRRKVREVKAMETTTTENE